MNLVVKLCTLLCDPAVSFSGQSNMVFPLKLAYNPQKEAASLKQPQFRNMRFFMTSRATATKPQWTLSTKPTACDTETRKCDQWLTADQALAVDNAAKDSFLMDFSAVCFMAVRDVMQLQAPDVSWLKSPCSS